jgi:hypothetical protein
LTKCRYHLEKIAKIPVKLIIFANFQISPEVTISRLRATFFLTLPDSFSAPLPCCVTGLLSRSLLHRSSTPQSQASKGQDAFAQGKPVKDRVLMKLGASKDTLAS